MLTVIIPRAAVACGLDEPVVNKQHELYTPTKNLDV